MGRKSLSLPGEKQYRQAVQTFGCYAFVTLLNLIGWVCVLIGWACVLIG